MTAQYSMSHLIEMEKLPNPPFGVAFSVQKAQLPDKVADLLGSPHDHATQGVHHGHLRHILVDVGGVEQLDAARDIVYGGAEVELVEPRLEHVAQLGVHSLESVALRGGGGETQHSNDWLAAILYPWKSILRMASKQLFHFSVVLSF